MTTAGNSVHHLIVVGGTFEHNQWGLLHDTVFRTNHLWHPHWVAYLATYGTPESYEASKADGKKKLRTQFMALPQEAILAIVAYSQGSAIVDEVLAEMAVAAAAGERGSISVLARIRYVGLVANPHRELGDQVGADPGGFGISGPVVAPGSRRLPHSRKRLINGRVENFALPGDVICACPANSLIRIVEQLTPMMSSSHPEKWAADLRQKLTWGFIWTWFPELRSPITPAKLLKLRAHIREAADLAIRYQASQIHTKYANNPIGGIDMVATRWIANQLNDIARASA